MYINIFLEIILLVSSALLVYYGLNYRLQKRLRNTKEICSISQREFSLADMFEYHGDYVSEEVYRILSKNRPSSFICITTEEERAQSGVDLYNFQKDIWERYQVPVMAKYSYINKKEQLITVIEISIADLNTLNKEARKEILYFFKPRL